MMTRLLSCLTAAAAAACGASPAAPGPFTAFGLGAGEVTAAYEYRHAPGDGVDVQWQEAYHRWALEALDVTIARRIVYNKYRSRAHMKALLGIGDTNAFANSDTFEIHTIWPRDNHEVVHLMAASIGRPAALWSEGLAVAHQTDPAAGDLVPRWSGVALDDHARRFRADGRLIPIAELLTTAGFRRFDSNVTYPQAGSFMRFVLDTCGLTGVKQFYAAGAVWDDGDRVSTQFEAACGLTIQVAEQTWLARLDFAVR